MQENEYYYLYNFLMKYKYGTLSKNVEITA